MSKPVIVKTATKKSAVATKKVVAKPSVAKKTVVKHYVAPGKSGVKKDVHHKAPPKKTSKLTVQELSKKVKDLKDDEPIVDEEVWAAVNSFFEENGLNSAQIQSYNDMIYNKIHRSIDQIKHLKIEEGGKCYKVEFGELIFTSPRFTESDDTTHTLYPMEATWRNITYASEIYIDVTITPPSGESSLYEKVYLGNMPVMVGSDLCNLAGIVNDPEKMARHSEDILDRGGYFLIYPKNEKSSGSTTQRRVLVPQERAAPNRVFIFSNRKDKPKYKTYAEIRSTNNGGIHTTTTIVGLINQKISCVLPWIDASEIPLGVVFRALGIEDENEMALLCLGPDYKDDLEALSILVPTLESSYECDNQDAALHFIGRRGRKFMKDIEKDQNDDNEEQEDYDSEEEKEEEKKKQESACKNREEAISYARHLLSMEMVPHSGQGEETYAEKARFVGFMAHKLIDVILKRREPEDRDHYMNKRIITTGALLAQQFYGAFRRVVMEITNNTKIALNKGHMVNITSWIKPKIITNAMNCAIGNNAWNTGGNTSKGISQLYEQYNYAAGIANMRKLTVPMIAEGGTSITPRDLHQCHAFIICVTGDTEVVLADGTVCRMDEVNGRPVMTVHPDTMKNEPSTIHSSFNLFSEKLLMIKDESDRSIRCTPDHPFLVYKKTCNEWVCAKELTTGMRVVATRESSTRFVNEYDLGEGKVASKIKEITKVPGDTVYDFTTVSPNHSFIANGFVTHNCPAETPEGKKAGLVKNMALSCLITVGTDPAPVKAMVLDYVGDRAEESYPESEGWVKIFVNGTHIGSTDTPVEFVKKIVRARRSAELGSETSVAYFEDHREIQISTEPGRLCRPVFVVENGELLFKTSSVEKLVAGELTWTQLLAAGTVELLDKCEEESALIAGYPSDFDEMTKEKRLTYTHCEMHPSMMFGIGGSIIPFPDHNQCIHEEEQVYMANGERKMLKDVLVGDKVVNFDPVTGKRGVSTVTNVLVKKTIKQMYELETSSGNKIKATYDHRFITPFGWKSVDCISQGDSVGILDSYLGSTYICDSVKENLIFVPIIKKRVVNTKMIADITTDSPSQSFICGEGFGVHNSPRNTYQSAMGKQAIGVPFTNYRHMMSGTFHTMQYLQKPLALSRSASIIGFDEMPAGQNAVVAVLPRPFNEEDSIEINQDSIDRGFMVSYKWMNYYVEVSEEKKEEFGVPTEETCTKFRGDPTKLLPEGYPKPGTKLEEGDIIVGKIAELEEDDKEAGTKRYVNKSTIYEHKWPSVVDSVQLGTTADGYEYVRVCVAQRREPVIGDKFAARHGQKGTTGAKTKSVDLPFTREGIVPDIIMNSLAFPSRMTIAMLIEMWTGKAVASSSPLHEVTTHDLGLGAGGMDAEDLEEEEGEWEGLASANFNAAFKHPTNRTLIDATPFRKTFSIDIIKAEMGRYGLKYGDEYLIDGVTGKPLRSLVFFCLAYYQRLKHMVIDKMHARSRGGRTTLTRQSKEGRALGGGLRTGCMERDCLLGQGAAKFTRDRLMEQSDEFRMWVCDVCGLPAHVEKQGALRECRICCTSKVSCIRIPFGSKLVQQEMMAMNIVTRTMTQPHDEITAKD